jgi:hypothetical protein
MKMRIASALTKPTITDRGMNRMSFATPASPSPTWMTPARITVATRYSSPCACTRGAVTSATDPVAAEIIAGRPPTNAIVTAIVNEANSPTRGSTPATIENAIASGISARATTRPASTSMRSRRGDRRAVRTDHAASASGGPVTTWSARASSAVGGTAVRMRAPRGQVEHATLHARRGVGRARRWRGRRPRVPGARPRTPGTSGRSPDADRPVRR